MHVQLLWLLSVLGVLCDDCDGCAETVKRCIYPIGVSVLCVYSSQRWHGLVHGPCCHKSLPALQDARAVHVACLLPTSSAPFDLVDHTLENRLAKQHTRTLCPASAPRTLWLVANGVLELDTAVLY